MKRARPDYNIAGISAGMYDFQAEAVRWIRLRERPGAAPRGGLIFSEMGTGKTRIMLSAILESAALGRATLIVGPVSGRDTWAAEIGRHAPTAALRDLGTEEGALLVYATPAALVRKKGAQALMRARFHRLVIDEGDFLRNDDSTLIFTVLSRVNATVRWVLTGTPYHLHRGNVDALAHMVGASPEQVPDIMIAHDKTMLPVALPPCTWFEHRLALTPDEAAAYADAHERTRWVIAACAASKLAALRALLDARPDERFLVFSPWVASVDAVAAAVPGTRVITGTTPARARDAILADVRAGAVRVLAMGLRAGNASLNLPQFSQVVLMGPWFDPQLEAQAVARAHRNGQTRPVDVHRLLAVGTCEEDVRSVAGARADAARDQCFYARCRGG